MLLSAYNIIRRSGLNGFAERILAVSMVSYARWISLNEPPRLAYLRERQKTLPAKPLIAVLMPVFNPAERDLVSALNSVLGQTYEEWELCVADDASTLPHVRRILESYAKREPRMKVAFRDSNGHISRASNSALELVTAKWIALLDHDDALAPTALAEVAVAITEHPKAQIIYSDEDKITEKGQRFEPFFKPDYSPEMFRSMNYFNHLTVHRAGNIRRLGGWRVGFEGSQDYDLNLRVLETIDAQSVIHIPRILYHWRTSQNSAASSDENKSYAHVAGRRALDEHLARTEYNGDLAADENTIVGYRVVPRVPDPAPLVSIIIPTRDAVDLLRRCVDSIVERTRYPNYEILVIDNRSADPAALAYLAELDASPRRHVHAYTGEFNYSAINNFAATKARGSVLALVNNDIEVISSDWLTEMVAFAVRPDIGCVGAKLYYPDGTIQHGGVIVGLGGVAGHGHKGFPHDAPGYFNRLRIVQNLSAVTAACLVVRKSVFDEVGGLDTENLAVAFNDVDFCLRVADAGYRNVWTPYAELYHHESATRGVDDNPIKSARFKREVDYMRGKWGGYRDPFYSPNLTVNREDYSLGAVPSYTTLAIFADVESDAAVPLIQWVAYHRAMGADLLFLFGDGQNSQTTLLLRQLHEAGIIVHLSVEGGSSVAAKSNSIDQTLSRFANGAKWLASLTTSEFIVPIEHFQSVRAALATLPAMPNTGAMVLNYADVSVTPPAGGQSAVELLRSSAARSIDWALARHLYKSLARGVAVSSGSRTKGIFTLKPGFQNQHTDGRAVVDAQLTGRSRDIVWKFLRLNSTRSLPSDCGNADPGQREGRNEVVETDLGSVENMLGATLAELARIQEAIANLDAN